MAEFLERLAALYAIVAAVVCFFVAIITSFDAEYETNVVKFAFYTERGIWRSLKDELNTAGLIIVGMVVVFFCLPANLLLLVSKLTILFCAAIWDRYKKVFARKTRADNG